MCVCVCIHVLSGASREAAHVLSEPGVELRLNQLPGLVQVSRLSPAALSSLCLDLTRHLPPCLST